MLELIILKFKNLLFFIALYKYSIFSAAAAADSGSGVIDAQRLIVNSYTDSFRLFSLCQISKLVENTIEESFLMIEKSNFAGVLKNKNDMLKYLKTLMFKVKNDYPEKVNNPYFLTIVKLIESCQKSDEITTF